MGAAGFEPASHAEQQSDGRSRTSTNWPAPSGPVVIRMTLSGVTTVDPLLPGVDRVADEDFRHSRTKGQALEVHGGHRKRDVGKVETQVLDLAARARRQERSAQRLETGRAAG